MGTGDRTVRTDADDAGPDGDDEAGDGGAGGDDGAGEGEPAGGHERAFPPELDGEVPGGSEVPGVAWPLLLRRRVQRKLERSDRHRWWVLWSVLSGLFAAGFSFTILAVSIPDIAEDLGASETALTWTVSGPLLMFAVGMPVLGKIGDLHGHRKVYLTGISLFVVFTGLSALAWNATALILIRVLAGLEGAATGPASMALINRTFPPAERVKAMGFFSLVAAGAPVIGLVAGGVVVDAFGWRTLFVMQLPLAASAVVVNAVVLRETPPLPRVSLDLKGATALAVTAVSALLALERGNALGWGHPVVAVAVALVPLGAVAFVAAERRARDPLVQLRFFRRRNFSASLIAQFFANVSYMGGFIISPLLMQHVFGYSVAAAAVTMIWRPLSFSLSAPGAGYLATRIGERTATLGGTGAIAASLLVLAAAASSRSVTLVVVGLVISGIGMGLANPSLQSSVANAVEEEHLGVAGAAQQMMFTVGASAGIQGLSVSLGGSRTAGAFVDSYLLGFALAVVAVIASLFVRSFERDHPAPADRVDARAEVEESAATP